jgi:hypothetical protein
LARRTNTMMSCSAAGTDAAIFALFGVMQVFHFPILKPPLQSRFISPDGQNIMTAW